jgi:hypothetical protein
VLAGRAARQFPVVVDHDTIMLDRHPATLPSLRSILKEGG